MKRERVSFQIGKKGLTDGFIENIKNAFNGREDVRISVLKAAGHERDNVKNMAEEIVEKLGKNYVYKIVGFTIFVKKFRKNVR